MGSPLAFAGAKQKVKSLVDRKRKQEGKEEKDHNSSKASKGIEGGGGWSNLRLISKSSEYQHSEVDNNFSSFAFYLITILTKELDFIVCLNQKEYECHLIFSCYNERGVYVVQFTRSFEYFYILWTNWSTLYFGYLLWKVSIYKMNRSWVQCDIQADQIIFGQVIILDFKY